MSIVFLMMLRDVIVMRHIWALDAKDQNLNCYMQRITMKEKNK